MGIPHLSIWAAIDGETTHERGELLMLRFGLDHHPPCERIVELAQHPDVDQVPAFAREGRRSAGLTGGLPGG